MGALYVEVQMRFKNPSELNANILQTHLKIASNQASTQDFDSNLVYMIGRLYLSLNMLPERCDIDFGSVADPKQHQNQPASSHKRRHSRLDIIF